MKMGTLLAGFLTKDVIQLNLEVEHWKQALQAGGTLLYAAGKCTPEYMHAIIHAVEELGPYMVLTPGIVLAHARPEDGVHEVGLSLITLSKPVHFGNLANDPVKVVITFCATDHESHVDMLKALSTFLRNNNHRKVLREAQSVDEVIAVFSAKLQGG